MLELPPSGDPSGPGPLSTFYGPAQNNALYGLQPNYDQLIRNHYYNNYYGVIQTGGLQQSELLKIMSILAKFKFGFSIFYILQGGFGHLHVANLMKEESDSFRGLCQTEILAGVAGSLTSIVGLWALSRYRWKCTMVAYLVMSILSAVAFLLVIIHCGIWLGRAQAVVGMHWIKIMTAIMLLAAVALGVCFIVSSAFICHLWAKRSKQRKYRVLGPFGGPTPFSVTNGIYPFQGMLAPNQAHVAPPILMGPPQFEPPAMKTLEYHICTSQCQH